MFLPKDVPPLLPCWLEQVSDLGVRWSCLLPCWESFLAGFMPKFLSDSPVMKLKQAAGTWCLVAVGSWCGPHSFSTMSASASPITERVLLANGGTKPSRRDAASPLLSKLRYHHQRISATCLVGSQALVPATFSVCYRERCWPPASEIKMKNSSACSLPLLWLPCLLLGTQMASSCCSGAFSSTLLLCGRMLLQVRWNKLKKKKKK